MYALYLRSLRIPVTATVHIYLSPDMYYEKLGAWLQPTSINVISVVNKSTNHVFIKFL